MAAGRVMRTSTCILMTIIVALLGGTLDIAFEFQGVMEPLTGALNPGLIKEPPFTPSSTGIPALSAWGQIGLAGLMVVGAVGLLVRRLRTRSS